MVFAYIFLGLSLIIMVFQIALALGAPWGDFTMGGKFPGKLPASMRIGALVQILILGFFVAVVLSKAGLALPGFMGFSRIAIWFIFGFFVLGTFLNLSSPSKKEKLVMGPLNILALGMVLMVALL